VVRLLLSLFFPLVLLSVFYSVPAGLLAPQSRPALFPPGTPLSIAPSWCDPYGITILLMGEDPEIRFDRNLQDASRLGARWVQLSFPTYLRNHDSIEFPVLDRRTPDLSTVQRSIMRAKSSGFKVALHPILLIQDPEDPHWRGQLDPMEKELWYDNYQQWIVQLGRLAQRCHVDLFFVGSELSSMQNDRAEWLKILKSVRLEFSGPVTYSANWDKWAQVSFAEQLDGLGVNGYVPFPGHQAQSGEQLIQHLLPFRSRLLRWSEQVGLPIFFSEVGYPSHSRALDTPWNQYQGQQIDVESQKRGYEAFIATFSGDQQIRGVFFYALHRDGGLRDAGYTPIGKPAEEIIRKYLGTISRVDRK